jgi:hypothetical protein
MISARSSWGANRVYRRGYLERPITMSFDGVAASAIFLEDNLPSSLYFAGVGDGRESSARAIMRPCYLRARLPANTVIR